MLLLLYDCQANRDTKPYEPSCMVNKLGTFDRTGQVRRTLAAHKVSLKSSLESAKRVRERESARARERDRERMHLLSTPCPH